MSIVDFNDIVTAGHKLPEDMSPEELAQFESEMKDWADTYGENDPPSEETMDEMEAAANEDRINRLLNPTGIAALTFDEVPEYCKKEGLVLADHIDTIEEKIAMEYDTLFRNQEAASMAVYYNFDAAEKAEKVRRDNGYDVDYPSELLPKYLADQAGLLSPDEYRAQGAELRDTAETEFNDGMLSLTRRVMTVDKNYPGVITDDTKLIFEDYIAAVNELDKNAEEIKGKSDAESQMTPLGGIDFSKDVMPVAASGRDVQIERQAPESEKQADTIKPESVTRKPEKMAHGTERYLPAGYEQFNSVGHDPDYGFDEGEFN